MAKGTNGNGCGYFTVILLSLFLMKNNPAEAGDVECVIIPCLSDVSNVIFHGFGIGEG